MTVGFTQLQRNRWAFVLHLPDGLGAVYASLGGTEWEPLWSCPYPHFWFRLSVDGGVTQRYGQVVAAFLERHGVLASDRWRCDLSLADHETTETSEAARP